VHEGKSVHSGERDTDTLAHPPEREAGRIAGLSAACPGMSIGMPAPKVGTPLHRVFLFALVPQFGLYPVMLWGKWQLAEFVLRLYYPGVIGAGLLVDALGIRRGPGDLGGLRTLGFIVLFGPPIGMIVYAILITAMVASFRRFRGRL